MKTNESTIHFWTSEERNLARKEAQKNLDEYKLSSKKKKCHRINKNTFIELDADLDDMEVFERKQKWLRKLEKNSVICISEK